MKFQGLRIFHTASSVALGTGTVQARAREEARLNGQVLDLRQIRQATVERNGQVSVISTD